MKAVTKDHYVLVFPKSTNTQSKLTNTTSPTTKTMETLQQSTKKIYQTLTSWSNVNARQLDKRVTMSDTQRYKQCGNGVVSNVVQAIMEKLL